MIDFALALLADLALSHAGSHDSRRGPIDRPPVPPDVAAAMRAIPWWQSFRLWAVLLSSASWRFTFVFSRKRSDAANSSCLVDDLHRVRGPAGALASARRAAGDARPVFQHLVARRSS